MAVHLLVPWDLVVSALNDYNDDGGHHCRHHQQSASFASSLISIITIKAADAHWPFGFVSGWTQ